MCRDMALLIERRLIKSLSNRVYSLTHEINALSRVAMPKSLKDDLGLFYFDEVESILEVAPYETILDVGSMLGVEIHENEEIFQPMVEQSHKEDDEPLEDETPLGQEGTKSTGNYIECRINNIEEKLNMQLIILS